MFRIAVSTVAAVVFAASHIATVHAADTESVAALGPAAQQSLAALKAKYQRPTSIPFPSDNPYSVEKAQLGQMLFFDPRMSGDNYIACASCHNPALSWGDGLPRGIGTGMTKLARRTPTVLNLAWAELLMWDGRKPSLEEQALGPIQTDVEMNQNLDDLVKELSAINEYKLRFTMAFPGEGLTGPNIGKAIATFERTIVSNVAPFDRWIAGDESAISPAAKRGFDLFNNKANCAACHSGWNFTDGAFHDIGLPSQDVGRYKELSLPSMMHAFKTPTLRDVDRRGPYMHDGSLKTLVDVMRHYNGGGIQRPSLSGDMKKLDLTKAEIADVIAFMQTLTSDDPLPQVPRLPVAPQPRREAAR